MTFWCIQRVWKNIKIIFESCFNDCETTSYTPNSASEFWINKVPFLGHVASPEEIMMDLGKVKDVLDWKPPMSITQVRSFLGLAGYYYIYSDLL
jgi:hypothetical protein